MTTTGKVDTNPWSNDVSKIWEYLLVGDGELKPANSLFAETSACKYACAHQRWYSVTTPGSVITGQPCCIVIASPVQQSVAAAGMEGKREGAETGAGEQRDNAMISTYQYCRFQHFQT